MFAPGESAGKAGAGAHHLRIQVPLQAAGATAATDAQRAAGAADRAGRRPRLARGRSPAARRHQRHRRRIGVATTSPTPPAASHFDAPVGAHRHPRRRPPRVAKSEFKVTLTAGKSLTTTWYVLARERYTSTVRGQRGRRDRRADALRRRAAPHPRHAGRHAQGGAEPPRRGALALRRRPARRVGLGAARHAHLRRRRLHPDALSLRRAALDGEQRDGLVAASSCPAATASSTAAASAASSRSRRATRAPTAITASCSSISIDGSLMIEGPITKNLSFAVARAPLVDRRLSAHLHDERLPALADLLRLPGQAALARLAARRRRHLHLRQRRRRSRRRQGLGRSDAVGGVRLAHLLPPHPVALAAPLRLARDADGDAVDRLRRALRVQGADRQHQPRRRRRARSSTTCAPPSASRSAAASASTPALDLEGNRWSLLINGPQRAMPREGDMGSGFGGGLRVRSARPRPDHASRRTSRSTSRRSRTC